MSRAHVSPRVAATRHDPAIAASAFAPHWTPDALADAVAPASPLHRFAFAPSASDARLHRPHRGASFLPSGAGAGRFRIGG